MMHRIKRIVLSIVIVLCAGFINSSAIDAATYNLKEMTPQVKAALQNRKDRFAALEELKAAGKVGENNKGYVELIKPADTAKEVVMAENNDRKVIYQTIAQQNEIESQISLIEKVFAQVQREKAESGYKIQQEDGDWVTK